MPTLFLALLLTTVTAASPVEQQITPYHYISTVGYVDVSASALPDYTLTWPTTVTKLSRGFSADHPGMDIDTRAGQPITAAFYGTVTEVTHAGPYGNKIIVSHPSHPEQIATLYAHLQDVYVNVGDVVYTSTIIGTVGRSGYATGDHLHIEVRQDEVQVDPIEYFSSDPK